MAIPPFDPSTGLLPPGEHDTTWSEIQGRLGWNEHRRRLLSGLARGLAILAEAGCAQVWLDGSFVTATDEPATFLCVWSTSGVDREVLEHVGPTHSHLGHHRAAQLFDFRHHRRAQKSRYGGSFLPDVVDATTGRGLVALFQTDRDRNPKGVVVFDPTKESWA